MKKKIPQRICISCKVKTNKNNLIRIVKDLNNNIYIDKTGKKHGRGAYICNKKSCLEYAMNKNVLSSKLKIKITQIEIIQLFQIVKKEYKEYNN